jgi:Tol biopolymer transport system component
VVRDVAIAEGWNPIVAAAENGSFAYARGAAPYPPRELVWVDKTGREEPIDAPARAWWWPRISPDGRRLGLHIMDPINMDAWIYELDHGPLIRMTYDPRQDGFPLWSPDAKQIVFWSRQGGFAANLYLRSADLTGADRRLTVSDSGMIPFAWTPDGSHVVFQRDAPETGLDIGLVSVDGQSSPTLLIAGPSDESKPALSPDGRWIAYQSNLSGRWEVYVQPFPDLEGRWQISTAGGVAPLWNPTGTVLYFRQENAVMSVAVSTDGDTFGFGNPQPLFAGTYVPEEHDLFDAPSYVVSPDGERFLMIKEPEQSPTEIVVIANWASELRQRVR